MPQAVDGKEDKSAPDDQKSDETRPVERLAVNQGPDEELERRTDVLQQADRRERDPPHRDGEAKQRGDRRRPGHSEEQVGRSTMAAESAALCRVLGGEIADRRQEQEHGFEGQRRQRVEGSLLFHEPIGAEGGGEIDRDPGKLVISGRDPGDARRRDSDGHPLGGAESLPQHRDAEKNTDQRSEVIAQAALDHPAVGHAPDEAEPVGTHECRRSEMPRQHARTPQHSGNLPPSPPPPQQRHKRQARPDNAMGDELEARDRVELLPVDRQQPPHDEGHDSAQMADVHASGPGDQGIE